MSARRAATTALLAVAAFGAAFAIGRSLGEEPARAAGALIPIEAPPQAPSPSLTAAAPLPRLDARPARRQPAPVPAAAPEPAAAPAAPEPVTPVPAAPAPVAPAPAPPPPPPADPPPEAPFYSEE